MPAVGRQGHGPVGVPAAGGGPDSHRVGAGRGLRSVGDRDPAVAALLPQLHHVSGPGRHRRSPDREQSARLDRSRRRGADPGTDDGQDTCARDGLRRLVRPQRDSPIGVPTRGRCRHGKAPRTARRPARHLAPGTGRVPLQHHDPPLGERRGAREHHLLTRRRGGRGRLPSIDVDPMVDADGRLRDSGGRRPRQGQPDREHKNDEDPCFHAKPPKRGPNLDVKGRWGEASREARLQLSVQPTGKDTPHYACTDIDAVGRDATTELPDR